MVLRPPADRKILELQNAELATAWIVFCGEMSRSDERRHGQHRWYYTGPTGNQSLS